MERAKVVKKRVFFPYRIYLDTADHFGRQIRSQDHPSWYDLMACMTSTVLATEAILNTFGSLSVPDFGDFEQSPPVAKMRVVCDTLKIKFNKREEPFASVVQLLKIRNKFAHPKYKMLSSESPLLPLEAARREYRNGEPLHDLEKALTPQTVLASLIAVQRLAQLLSQACRDTMPLQVSSAELVFEGTPQGSGALKQDPL